MTVRELIEALKEMPPEAEALIAYDSGCAYTDILAVELNSDCDMVFVSDARGDNNGD